MRFRLCSPLWTTETGSVIYDSSFCYGNGNVFIGCVNGTLSAIRASLKLEYRLLALVTSVFALVLGTAVAVPLLVYALAVPAQAAVSISLAAVGATALIGAIARLPHAPGELVEHVAEAEAVEAEADEPVPAQPFLDHAAALLIYKVMGIVDRSRL